MKENRFFWRIVYPLSPQIFYTSLILGIVQNYCLFPKKDPIKENTFLASGMK
jgi:hypothetical protein